MILSIVLILSIPSSAVKLVADEVVKEDVLEIQELFLKLIFKGLQTYWLVYLAS